MISGHSTPPSPTPSRNFDTRPIQQLFRLRPPFDRATTAIDPLSLFQAGPSTGKIATQGHKTRTSLLSGATAYEPLSGNSFSSNTRPSFAQTAYAPGGYHDRQGLTTSSSAAQTKATLFFLPKTTWTWAFFLITLVQCILSLALEAYVFGEFQTSLEGSDSSNLPDDEKPHVADDATTTIPTYLGLYIFGFLYELVLVWDALRLKNTIQVIGVCMYNLGLLIYAAVEMDQVDDAIRNLAEYKLIEIDTWTKVRPFLIAGPCILALGTVLLSLVAWKLYDEFAWTIYKNISADLRLKRRYLTYQIYIALLKFDFFFFLGFTVQFLVAVKGNSPAEHDLTIAAIPITVGILFLAAYITRRESYVGQSGVIVVYFAAMAYFIFKLVRMYDSYRVSDYAPVRPSLTTFAVITIMCLIVTIVTAFICMRNFNKGLRPHIQKRKVVDVDKAKFGTYGNGQQYNGAPHQLGEVPSRMTID